MTDLISHFLSSILVSVCKDFIKLRLCHCSRYYGFNESRSKIEHLTRCINFFNWYLNMLILITVALYSGCLRSKLNYRNWSSLWLNLRLFWGRWSNLFRIFVLLIYNWLFNLSSRGIYLSIFDWIFAWSKLRWLYLWSLFGLSFCFRWTCFLFLLTWFSLLHLYWLFFLFHRRFLNNFFFFSRGFYRLLLFFF